MSDELDSESEQRSRLGSGGGVASRCLSSFFVILRLQTMICNKTSERYDEFGFRGEMPVEGLETINRRL